MGEPIAIVGMAARFPDADDVDALWANVLQKRSAIRTMLPERFDAERYYDPEQGAYGKSYTRLGGLIDEAAFLAQFDGRPYRMPPKAVQATDVAHLWAIDTARRAFEDAGLDPFALEQRNVGVILGHARGSMRTADLAFSTGIEGLLAHLPPHLAHTRDEAVARVRARYGDRTEDGSVGAMTSGLAGRVALAFGLTGRHSVVDAACASTLAAVQMGVNALRQGRLQACLVGGVSYSQQLSVVMFAQSRALSPDGSFPFDARANGFVSSDGSGIFLLERLSDALRAGHPIRAVIRGVGGACDGKGRALWSPQQKGQILAMKRALADGGVDPSTVDLLEAHATSTKLGDRVEVEAMHAVFGDRPRELAVGSIKGNLGHAREAAGAAGMVKAIRALEEGVLPPTGGFRDPSPEIPWHAVKVRVLSDAERWQSQGPRRAGVNAFGIGGLDYHVLLEEPPARRSSVTVDTPVVRNFDVAVVGLGVRLPGADSLDALQANLRKGADTRRRIPAERWDPDLYAEPGPARPHRSYQDHGFVLDGFTPDWRRYRVPPKLVERNDPLQFMVLEAALDALEHAGLSPEALPRDRTATFVGTVFGSDFALGLSEAVRAIEAADAVASVAGETGARESALEALRAARPTINEDSSGSFSSSTLASRVAKTLDLNGPTLTVDAACASSLASVEAACELLASGDCEVVLAGGGDRSLRIQRFEAYCRMGALSASGEPRPYDADADGFLPGEGAAMLVLMRRETAEAKGLPIRAVIRGIGSTSEAQPAAMFRPSAEGIGRAIERALEQAGLPPEAVGYIEGHGGGTSAGDEAELAAIAERYRGQSQTPLHLGSIKSHLGHLQGAAGVAGLVQACLTLQSKQTPGVPHFQCPSAALGQAASVSVSNQPRELPESTWAVGVSALGLGGIDYHAVLASADAPEAPSPLRITVARADDDAELLQRAADGGGDGVRALALVSSTEVERETQLALLNKMGLGEATRELREKKGIFFVDRALTGKLGFAFSGQGSQYDGMLQSILHTPEARACIEELEAAIDGPSPFAAWRAGRALPTGIFEVQALVLAADLIQLERLRRLGIEPDVVTGHSFGDYAALVAAGAWSAGDAMRITRARATAIESAGVSGGMVALSATAEAATRLARASDTYVANLNAPDQMVLAGSPEGLERLVAAAEAEQVRATRLPVPGPFHSPLMGPAVATLSAALAQVELRRPRIPYLSSVTARLQSDPDQIRGALARQLTEPVRFGEQCLQLKGLGVDVVVEVGPRAVLRGLVRRCEPDLVSVATDHPKLSPELALGYARAVLQMRAPSAPTQMKPPMENDAPAPEPALELFHRDRLEALLAEPGFAAFFERVRPSVAAFVEGLWQAEQPEASSATPDPETPDPETPSAVAPAADKAQLQAFLLDALCEESGYPEDLIEMDADLEADLGIDTVKQAQVLGRLRDRYRLKADPNLSLRDFPTLRHMVDYADRQLAQQPAAPVRVSTVSVVDLTSRRTGLPARARASHAQASSVNASETDSRPARPERSTVSSQGAIPSSVAGAPAPRPLASTLAPSSVAGAPAPRPLGSTLAPSSVAGAPAPRPLGSTLAPSEPLVIEPLDLDFDLPPPRSVPAPDAPRPVTLVELRGTPRARGHQHGEAMLDPIRETLDAYLGFVGRHGLEQVDLPRALAEARRYLPHSALEEIAGVAEAVGVPERWLLAYNLDAALFPAHAPGCTHGVRLARANEGRLVHFANEDSPLLLHLGRALPRVAQRRIQDDGRELLTFSLAGQIAGIDAVRSDGITLTSTTLLDAPARAGATGLPHPFLVLGALENAEDYPAVLDYLRSARRTGRWSVLVSDAATDQAHYLEYEAERMRRDEAVQDTWLGTNHALGEPGPTHSSCRLERVRDLAEVALDAESARALLHDRHDLERGREVAHPTMNTIRRVDCVMSLVVEPGAGRVLVDAHVEAPGRRRGEVPALELRLPPAVPAVERVMHRHVVRLRVRPLPPGDAHRLPDRVQVVGEDALAERSSAWLRSQGVEPTQDPAPGLLLIPPLEADADWLARAFDAARRWAKSGPSFIGTLTRQGGCLGFDNASEGAPLHAAVGGLVKAARRELEGVKALVLDVDPRARPEDAFAAFEEELKSGLPRIEVGRWRGRRIELSLPRQPVTGTNAAWPRRWLVTGGGRGVTAHIARRLAETTGCSLEIFGRRPLPEGWAELGRATDLDLERMQAELLTTMKSAPGFSARAWKEAAEQLSFDRELARNLSRIEQLGVQVRYHAVDLADPASVRAAVEGLDAPIDGLIHGAGYELAKALQDKTETGYARTLGPKLFGLQTLLDALDSAPLRYVLGFGSVSGRFGGHGQVDYAMANEGMAAVLRKWAAKQPRLRACVVDWAAFSEVGLAARSSARAFLERAGQAFMTPEEGFLHVFDELAAGLPEPEVVVCGDLSVIDLDRSLTPTGGQRGRLQSLDGESSSYELPLDPEDPLLAHHRFGETGVLPAAGMVDAFLDASDGDSLVDFDIRQALRVPTLTRARVERGARLRLLAPAHRPDGLLLELEREHALARVGSHPQPSARPFDSPPPEARPFPYLEAPDPSRLVWHGPMYQVLTHIVREADGGRAWLEASSSDRVPFLDGALQAAGLLARLHHGTQALPAGCRSLWMTRPAPGPHQLHVRILEADERSFRADILAVNAQGRPVLEVLGYEAKGPTR